MIDIVKIYEENGALLKGHFLLSSGLHSDKYLQSEQVMQFPNVAKLIVAEVVNKIGAVEFETVVSPAIGGIRFGYELASQLGKRSIFTERVDGAMQLRRGFVVKKGERFIVAEDVVTTGKSTKECIKAIEDAGGVIVAIASIIDRSGGEANFNVPFFSATKVEVKSYELSDCPLCKSGVEVLKPGSRVFK